jgi:hypothetical protein
MREPGLGETGVQLQHVLDAWAHAGSMAWRCGKCDGMDGQLSKNRSLDLRLTGTRSITGIDLASGHSTAGPR